MKRHFWILMAATVIYAGELIRLAIATPQLIIYSSATARNYFLSSFNARLNLLSYERELATAAFVTVIVLVFGHFFFHRSDVNTDAEKIPDRKPPSPAA